MNIIARHTFASALKNPFQTLIIIISVAVITACVLVSLSVSKMFEYTASQWVYASFGGSDLKIARHSDGADVREFLASESDITDEIIQTTEKETAIYSEETTVRAYMIAVDDVERFNLLNGAVILERAETPVKGCLPAYVSHKFLERTHMKLGDVFTLKSGTAFYIAAVCDDVSRYYAGSTLPFVTDRTLLDAAARAYYNYTYVYLSDAVEDKEAEAARISENAKKTFTDGNLYIENTYKDHIFAESVKGSMDTLSIAVSIIVFLMALLLFYSYSVIARGRSGEIIKFKAAGATPAQCTGIMFAEAVLYMLTGGLTGLGIGRLLFGYIDGMLTHAITSAVLTAEGWTYPAAVAIAFAAATAACLPSAVRIARKSVRQLMSGSAHAVKRVRPLTAVIFGIFAAALFVCLFVMEATSLMPVLIAFLIAACLTAVTAAPYILGAAGKAAGKALRGGEGKIAFAGVAGNAGICSSAAMLVIIIALLWAGICILDAVKITAVPAAERYTADYAVKTDYTDDAMLYAELDRLLAIYGIESGAVLKRCSVKGFVIDGKETDYQYECWGVADGESYRYLTNRFDGTVARRFDETEHPIILTYHIAKELGLQTGDQIGIVLNKNDSRMAEIFTVVGIDTTITNYDMTVVIRASDMRSVDNLPINLNTVIYLTGDTDLFRQIRPLADTEHSTLFKKEDYHFSNVTLDASSLLDAFAVIIYAIAATGLVNLIVITAAGRRKEMEIYRLAGMTPCGKFRMAICEGITVSLFGFVGGLICSAGIYRALPSVMLILNRYAVDGAFPATPVYIALACSAAAFVMWSLTPLISGRGNRGEARNGRSDM